MRAVFLIDSHQGPGYGLIKIYGINDIDNPVFSIRCVENNTFLAGETWRTEQAGLYPVSSNSFDEGMELHVGPGIVNELNPKYHYQVIIPGYDPLPLVMEGNAQSWIEGGEGMGLTPPPLPGTTQLGAPIPDSEIVYEGVERTPMVDPGEDAGNLPSGVAAVDDVSSDPTPKHLKKGGCLVMVALLFTVWIVGGWFLWQGAMKAPQAPTMDSAPFVLFPLGSANDDNSSTEQNDRMANP